MTMQLLRRSLLQAESRNRKTHVFCVRYKKYSLASWKNAFCQLVTYLGTKYFHEFHCVQRKLTSFQKLDFFSKNRLSVFDCLECYSFFAKERLSNVFQKTFIITESANSDFLRDPCNQTKVKLYTSICR